MNARFLGTTTGLRTSRSISVLALGGLAVLAFCLSNCASSTDTADGFQAAVERSPAGPMAADFVLTSLDGKTVSLSSLRGKPILLNFWATWCGWCVKEMPDMARLQGEMGNSVQIVGVDYKEDAPKVEQFMSSKNYDWMVLLDVDGTVAQSYDVGGFPTSFFINKYGEVVSKKVGAISYDVMKEEILKAKG